MSTYPDTHGWDTVFAISILEVNKLLAKLPDSPQFEAVRSTNLVDLKLSWRFTNWSITDTPGGAQLQVRMEFSDDSLLSHSDGTADTSLAGLACDVTFQAHFDDTDPQTQKLRAKTTGTWATVALVALDGGGLPNPNDTFAIKSILKDWFDQPGEAVELFQQEFAAVNMGAEMAAKGLEWLAPKRLGYAGAVMADGVTKALGILAMTGDKAPSDAELKLSPYVIPPNATAGYILSAELFLRHMLLPASAGAFGGEVADFEIVGLANDQLRNKNTLKFTLKIDSKSKPASIDAGQLQFSFAGDKLKMSITPMHAGTDFGWITLDATINEEFTTALIQHPDVPDGTIFTLSSAQYREPDIAVVIEHEAAVAEAVLTSLVAVLSIALMVVSFKGPISKATNKLGPLEAKIWARIAAGGLLALGEVAVNMPGWLALAVEGQTKHIPDFNMVLNEGLKGIVWPGGNAVLEPVAGEFANGLLVTVKPKFI